MGLALKNSANGSSERTGPSSLSHLFEEVEPELRPLPGSHQAPPSASPALKPQLKYACLTASPICFQPFFIGPNFSTCFCKRGCGTPFLVTRSSKNETAFDSGSTETRFAQPVALPKCQIV